jgi:hypothetical protein
MFDKMFVNINNNFQEGDQVNKRRETIRTQSIVNNLPIDFLGLNSAENINNLHLKENF